MNQSSETSRGVHQPLVGSWLENQGWSDRQTPAMVEQALVLEIPDTNVSAGTWTEITCGIKLVTHLLLLHFFWEYSETPPSQVISIQ